jgi:predicted small lipoprotein YifL
LALDRLNVAFAVAVIAMSAFALAACGRNGNPLPPPGPLAAGSPPTEVAGGIPPPGGAPAPTLGGPGASGPTAQETAQKTGFDIFGNPVAPAGQQKSFLLDPLLQ